MIDIEETRALVSDAVLETAKRYACPAWHCGWTSKMCRRSSINLDDGDKAWECRYFLGRHMCWQEWEAERDGKKQG